MSNPNQAALEAALATARNFPAPEGPIPLTEETLCGLGIRQAVSEALGLSIILGLLADARRSAENVDAGYGSSDSAKEALSALMPYLNNPWWVVWADEVIRLRMEARDRNWPLPSPSDVYDWLPGDRDRVPAWLSEPFDAGRIRNGFDAYMVAARHIRAERTALNERVEYAREAALPPMRGTSAGDAMLGRRG